MAKKDIIKCPHCGESYYSEGYTIATCMAYSRVFKDGKEISVDPNYYTTSCHCIACGKDFNKVEHEGKISVVPVNN